MNDKSPFELAFVDDPPSADICKWLNAAGASACEHGRNPCYLRCGARMSNPIAGWSPIPNAERLKWFADVRRNMRRCICVGTDYWCTHEGRCGNTTEPGGSDSYCGRCYANARAEADVQG